MALGLFRRSVEPDRLAIPRFNIETVPAPVPPSIALAQMGRFQQTIMALWGVMIVLLISTFGISVSLAFSAHTDPYVVDGGVFGCPVPLLSEDA